MIRDIAPVQIAPARIDWPMLAQRWRVLLLAIGLAALPWIVPSQALAVNILIFGLYATGFNLLFGFTGMLSFGHAAFFGAGAYGTGIALARFGIGWFGAIAIGIAVASLLALLIGALSIRSRGIYFSMVTLALAQLIYYVALQATGWTGGENGLRGLTVSTLHIGPLALNFLDPTVKYYIILIFVVAALWAVSRLLNAPFGAAIEAIRENEGRAAACGYDVKRIKLVAFALSGAICGLAGALNALHLSIVPIDSLSYQTSGLAVIMVLLGGAGTFLGPFVGAAIFLLIEDVFSLWTTHWQLFAGMVFILAVLFLPQGVWGTLVSWRKGRPHE
jgi:branched-chain amino acid transport system permease protein